MSSAFYNLLYVKILLESIVRRRVWVLIGQLFAGRVWSRPSVIFKIKFLNEKDRIWIYFHPKRLLDPFPLIITLTSLKFMKFLKIMWSSQDEKYLRTTLRGGDSSWHTKAASNDLMNEYAIPASVVYSMDLPTDIEGALSCVKKYFALLAIRWIFSGPCFCLV